MMYDFYIITLSYKTKININISQYKKHTNTTKYIGNNTDINVFIPHFIIV